MMPHREGQRLGNYRLMRLLGKGGFAEVYLAEHLYLKTYAAIKILPVTSLKKEDEQAFLTEARRLAQLVHPNIVRVHEFSIERSTAYLVMDYAEKGTLRQCYPRQDGRASCLSLDQTVSYTKQMAEALQYAHDRGIIHRDVKPENILQGRAQITLSDFGISLHLPTAGIQAWAGTLPYMAPEQFRSEAVYASDQYALAVIVYEWLCGVRPFEGRTSTELAYKHQQVLPPRLREKDPSLPEAVEAVVLKALSKNPTDRYVSVLLFARALERASQESESPNPPPIDDITVNKRPHLFSAPRRIFLSYAPGEDMTRFIVDLKERDVIVGNDPPQHDEEMVRQGVRAAQVVLLVVTPQTRFSPVIKEHLRIADLYRRPVLCVWATGNEIEELLPAGVETSTIIDARGQRYRMALDDILQYLKRERGGAPFVELLPETEFEPRNPYKGLQAFTQADRADFFGREALVMEMIETVRNMLLPTPSGTSDQRLMVVVGPSGSGKSSVVMAGLLPKLQDGVDGDLPMSKTWRYLDPLVPGKQPLDALTHVLAPHFPEKGTEVVRELLGQKGGYGLHQLALSLAHQGTYIVLLVDQFEELFSLDVAEQERQQFIDLLVNAATAQRGPVLVLLTLRADFYDRPLAYPELARLIQQHQCTVLPMDTQDLRAAIERPALESDVKLIFDEDLIGDLLFEIRGQAGTLPLLEFTLDQLFYHRHGHRLTRSAYEKIGGVRGALSQHAESVYNALPSEEHRGLTRSLFVRLIQPGETGQDPIRRRADLMEFSLEDKERTRLLREVIDAFIAARLLTSNQIAGTTTLEVSHEALLREWPRLLEWIRESSGDIRLQQSLRNDVVEWERRGKPRDRLYRGTQLKESLTWLERNTANTSERVFLRASTVRRTRGRLSLLLVALLIFTLLVPAGLLFLRSIIPLTVTTLADGGAGSLRQVIEDARSGSTIIIAPNLKGTLTLTHSLVIGKNLTIRGPGAQVLKISTTEVGDDGLIQVLQGATVLFSDLTFSAARPRQNSFFFNHGKLTLQHCTITGITNVGFSASSSPPSGSGVAISNSYGTLTLLNSTIADNTIDTGDGVAGAIDSQGGTVILTNSQLTDNTVKASNQTAFGGAISSLNDKLLLTNTTISRNKVIGGNKVSSTGGGIFINGGTVMLISSTVADNSVDGNAGSGGGINSAQTTMTLINSRVTNNTVTANTAASGGGIMDVGGSSITLTNSTISANTITAKEAFGGGVYSGIFKGKHSSLTITHTTVSDNTVKSTQGLAAGGGILSDQSTMTLINSRVTNNTVTANTAASGGGIMDVGGSSITLTNSTISANTITVNNHGVGGGIYADNGSITFTNSTISANTITAKEAGGGGGVYADVDKGKHSTLTITHTTVSDNAVKSTQGPVAGGGILDNDVLTITNSIISHNAVSSAFSSQQGYDAGGGGIKALGTLIMTGSTVTGNTVASGNRSAHGGGILVFSPLVAGDNFKLTNSTISDNTVSGSQGSDGGGIVFAGTQGIIDFCTIYGNSVSSLGGGIYLEKWNGKEANVTIKNTLIAHNSASTGPDIAGKFTTEGYNLIQRFAGAVFNDPHNMHRLDRSGDQFPDLGIDPQLHFNGGLTPTYALQPNSPAVNQIPASLCDVPTDQRGVKRPQQGSCDIGAYEYQPTS